MIKTSGEFEQEFINTAAEKTGNTVEQWMPVVKNSGLLKRQDIIKWLKSDYKLNHMQASLLSGICLNNGKAVYSRQNLLENQFINCKAMRHLYNHITEKILLYFKDAQCIPKRTYISCLEIKEFAAIKIEPKKIIIGVAVDYMAGNYLLQKAVLPGPSPAITHIIGLTGIRQFNSTVINYLQSSYHCIHNKK